MAIPFTQRQPTQYQSGYTEAGAAARGLPPTTVPPELRFPGETFVQSWVQHAQAASRVLPAVVAPGVGVAVVGLSAMARSDAAETAATARASAEEARNEWATGFRDFGMMLAGQQATFGRELQALRATSGGGSQTFFRMPSRTSSLPTYRAPLTLRKRARRTWTWGVMT